MTEHIHSRLESMFRTVADESVRQDCATVRLDTGDGDLVVEFGSFNDGWVLNVPTPTSGYDPALIIGRSGRHPDSTGGSYVVYEVDDLHVAGVADLVLTIADWDVDGIEEGKMKVIEHRSVIAWFADKLGVSDSQ